jgi:hypothetical protein
MFEDDDFTKNILRRYATHLEWIDTIDLNFTGVASERPVAVFTHETSEDLLLYGATVDFNNAGVLVRLRSINPLYQWMANTDPTPQDTPVNAVAGIFSQSLPILPLVRPFFIKKQGRLEMQFTNAAADPITGGLWTWRGLRLTNPINGGWDYVMGMGG